MSSNATSNLCVFTLCIWIVSVLTSPVSNELKTDGTSSTPTSNRNLTDASLKNGHKFAITTVPPASAPSSSSKMHNINDTGSIFMGEGGPILIVSSTEHAPPMVSHVPNILDNPSVGDNILKEKENVPFTTGRNIVQSKIVPRKGADQMIPNVKRIDSSLNDTSASNDTKPVVEPTALVQSTHIKEDVTNDDGKNQKINITIKHPDDISKINANANANSHDTSIEQQTTLANTTAKTVLTTKHKPKPKPTVTIGEPGIDKPIPASPTKSPPLGMPRKIDYIVPVVITIIALPLLGIASFIMYRQGRDCWDKRHYRRMDFLIDGMYND